jgi:hypothetical protein
LFIPFCTLFYLSKCIISTVGPYSKFLSENYFLFHTITILYTVHNIKMCNIIDSSYSKFFLKLMFVSIVYISFIFKIYNVISLLSKLFFINLIFFLIVQIIYNLIYYQNISFQSFLQEIFKKKVAVK